MGKASDGLRQQNEDLAHPNRDLIFRGVVEVPYLSHGVDKLYMKVLFSDKVKVSQFDPQFSIKLRSALAMRWGSLCDALGLDFNDIPFCHDWEVFVQRFIDFTMNSRGKQLYAKLTVNEDGWLVPGTGKCFSDRPDMEYSDEDKEHLKSFDEMDSNNKIKYPIPY